MWKWDTPLAMRHESRNTMTLSKVKRPHRFIAAEEHKLLDCKYMFVLVALETGRLEPKIRLWIKI
jgi:hypothetical protein